MEKRKKKKKRGVGWGVKDIEKMKEESSSKSCFEMMGEILISSLRETFKSNVWSDLNAIKYPSFVKHAKTSKIQYEEEQGLDTLNSSYHLTFLKVANKEEPFTTIAEDT